MIAYFRLYVGQIFKLMLLKAFLVNNLHVTQNRKSCFSVAVPLQSMPWYHHCNSSINVRFDGASFDLNNPLDVITAKPSLVEHITHLNHQLDIKLSFDLVWSAKECQPFSGDQENQKEDHDQEEGSVVDVTHPIAVVLYVVVLEALPGLGPLVGHYHAD